MCSRRKGCHIPWRAIAGVVCSQAVRDQGQVDGWLEALNEEATSAALQARRRVRSRSSTREALLRTYSCTTCLYYVPDFRPDYGRARGEVSSWSSVHCNKFFYQIFSG